MSSASPYIAAAKEAKIGAEMREPLAQALNAINGGTGFGDHGDYGDDDYMADLNNLIGHDALGVYWLKGSRSYNNLPYELGDGSIDSSGYQMCLTVYSWSGNFCRQVVEYMSTSPSYVTKKYVRCYVNGYWSAWYEV